MEIKRAGRGLKVLGYVSILFLAIVILLVITNILPLPSRLISESLSRQDTEGKLAPANSLPTPISTVLLPEPVATVIAHATQAAQASQTPDAIPTFRTSIPTAYPETVFQSDHAAWRYTVVRSNQGPMVANIDYDSNSISGLRAFAAANSALIANLVHNSQPTQVSITFRTYMAPSQFRTWSAAKGLQVRDSLLRITNKRGKGTAVVTAEAGDSLPQIQLADITRNRESTEDQISINGVYYTNASVLQERLLEIANDPLVFVADITPSIVRSEIIAAGIPGAAQAVIEPSPSYFYKMEDLGLENFR